MVLDIPDVVKKPKWIVGVQMHGKLVDTPRVAAEIVCTWFKKNYKKYLFKYLIINVDWPVGIVSTTFTNIDIVDVYELYHSRGFWPRCLV
jgi:hypothetical protein